MIFVQKQGILSHFFAVFAICCHFTILQNPPFTDISSTSYTCDCINGYSGNNCQIAPPCNQSPCNTGNTDECQNLNGNAICVCKTGFNGALCQNTIADSTDECINFPFEIKCNGCDQGACVTCSDNHHGKYCQFSSPCDANPCQNSGTCTQSADGEYTCTCVGHHHGKSCQLTPACQGAPCQNSGICSNLDDGDFTCACENSWSGKICDEHADLILGGLRKKLRVFHRFHRFYRIFKKVFNRFYPFSCFFVTL